MEKNGTTDNKQTQGTQVFFILLRYEEHKEFYTLKAEENCASGRYEEVLTKMLPNLLLFLSLKLAQILHQSSYQSF